MVVDGCLWSLPIAMPTTARVLALRGARPLLLANLFMLQKLIWGGKLSPRPKLSHPSYMCLRPLVILDWLTWPSIKTSNSF